MSGISGTVAAGGVTYNYLETSRKNSRGIDMWIKGRTTSKLEYVMRPNLHSADKKRRNKDQEAFYHELAQGVADIANGGSLPSTASVFVNDVEYELGQR